MYPFIHTPLHAYDFFFTTSRFNQPAPEENVETPRSHFLVAMEPVEPYKVAGGLDVSSFKYPLVF